MRTRFIIILFLSVFITSCTKNVDYTQGFMDETSGLYKYSSDEVIEVYYDNNKLFLNWRGVEKIKLVVLNQHTFFIADMYAKLRFVKHLNTNEDYLSIVNPENEDLVTYDYLKLSDSVNIPSGYLKNGHYDKALAGYLEIQKQDSTSVFINEWDFNRLGYGLLNDKNYQNAIDVFKINVALYPESSNVFDRLASAYLRSGDSIQAFDNYKKALALNKDNRSAKQFVNDYNEKEN
jgi:tetratricopeptide (TPR) repeat protein